MTGPNVKLQDRAYAQDGDRDNAWPGIIFPTSRLWTPTAAAITAQRVVYVRGAVSRPMKIHSLAFVVTTAAGANDSLDVGILDANLNALASSGNQTGALNSLGRHALALTADIVLLPRTVYYAAFCPSTFGGTAASLICANYPSSGYFFAGNTAGLTDMDFQSATNPLPVAGSTTTATGVNALNSATVNVGSTTGFPTTGAFLMGGTVTTYTGVTGTSFTGCSNHAATVGGEVIVPSITTHGGGTNNPVLYLVEA